MPKWTPNQDLAINLTGTNILVSAGAGSGKTAVLTSRVITHLTKGININNLLILTFTNAAALEMKMRIRKALNEREDLSEQLLLLDSSYITTFDSFALSIVRRYHYYLDIANDITITPSCIVEIESMKIIDSIFSNLYQNKNQDFLDLVSVFCLKDDKELRKSILKISQSMDSLVDKTFYLNNYIDNYFQEEQMMSLYEKYLALINDKVESLKKDLVNLISLSSQKNAFLINDIIKSFEDPNIKEVLEAINLPKKDKASLDEYSDERKRITSNIKEIISMFKYSSKNKYIEEILSTKKIKEVIISILKELDNRLNDYKKKNNLYTFYDIAKSAIKIVKENEKVREELKSQFIEIMVDEYQDTSDIQEELINLIKNNNLYMVGDVKQSIYGFRNANPSLFRAKYDMYDEDIKNPQNGVKINLLENFRSRGEVISSINDVFCFLMTKENSKIDYKASHNMIFGNKKYEENKTSSYDLEILNYSLITSSFLKYEKEAFIIANDIKNKIDEGFLVYDKDENMFRNLKYSDIAILIDKTTNFDNYKKIFEYLKIPLNIMQDESLHNGYNLKIFKNIFKFILLIKNKDFNEINYYFTSLARSYLFSYSDSVIYNTVKDAKVFQSDIYIISKKIADKMETLSFVDTFNLIIEEFSFFEKIAKIGGVDELIYQIDYLRSLLSSYNSISRSLDDLVDFLERIIDNKIGLEYSFNIGKLNGVKLMTIHKSKGLEYPVVYLAGLQNQFNEVEIRENILFSKELGIIGPGLVTELHEVFTKTLCKAKYKKDEIDERIRLFYVALTRAREKLVLVLDEDITESNFNDYLKINSFKSILKYAFSNASLNYVQKDITDKDVFITDEYKKGFKKINDTRVSENKISITPISDYILDKSTVSDFRYSKSSLKIDDEKTKKLKQEGLIIHRVLEVIDFENFNRDILRVSGIEENIIDIVEDFTSSSILKNIKNATVYKEYKFVDENNVTGVIDLMLEYENYIDIIDYKLKNIDDDMYKVQLNGYKEVIQNKKSKPVNIYLYSLIERKIVKL